MTRWEVLGLEHENVQEKQEQGSVIGISDVKVTLGGSDIGNIASTGEAAGKKEFSLLEEYWRHTSKVFWEIYWSLPV